MFTGIVEELGTVRSVRRGAHSSVLSISAKEVLSDLKVGDSVAVNGVCLTATTVDSGGFTADVMHETLNRSSLAGLTMGTPVNLERAMAADGRFGGHIVAGHAGDCCHSISRCRNSPSKSGSGRIFHHSDFFRRKAGGFCNITDICINLHGFTVDCQKAVIAPVSLYGIAFNGHMRLSGRIKGPFYYVRSFVHQFWSIVSGAFYSRLM